MSLIRAGGGSASRYSLALAQCASSMLGGRPNRAPARCAAAIGSALAARLHPFGIRTTADLVAMAPASARDVGTVVLERLVRELNGVECNGFKLEPEASKATAVTRQFGVPVTDLDALREAMVRRATRAAEKIRHQELVATWPIVFAHGATGPICPRRAARPGCRRSVTIRASSSALQPRRWRRCFSPGASIRSAAFCSRNCCRKPRGRGTSLPSRIRARAGCWPLWIGTTIGSGVGPSERRAGGSARARSIRSGSQKSPV